MLKAFVNAFKIPDLRKKILFTLFIIAVFRLGSHVPVPIVRRDHAAEKLGFPGRLRSLLRSIRPKRVGRVRR